MKLTIVSDDGFVSIDDIGQSFDLSSMLDPLIWAVQWDGLAGSKELRSGDSESIASIVEFQNIIDRYNLNETTVDAAVQTDFDNVDITYLSGYGDRSLTVQETRDASISFVAWALTETKTKKYTYIYNYADALIELQEDTFFLQGSSHTRNKERLAREQQKRNNKKIIGTTLTPQEELDDDKYDYFMDWADQVYDAANLAEDSVEVLPDIDVVRLYDVASEPSWPIWSPPV